MIKGSIYNALVALYSDHSMRSERERIEYIIYTRYNQGVYIVSNWVNERGNPEIEYKGYDLDVAKAELSQCTYVDGYEDLAQTWQLHECTPDDTYYNVIDSLDLDPINEETRHICYAVQQHFGGKYSSHSIDGGDSIKLRIADHSGKCGNNYGERCISIVIAELNPTQQFRMSTDGIRNEHFFNGEMSAEEIISEINILLLEEGVINDLE